MKPVDGPVWDRAGVPDKIAPEKHGPPNLGQLWKRNRLRCAATAVETAVTTVIRAEPVNSSPMKQRFKREGPWNMPMTDQDYIDRYKRRCVTNEQGCWVWQGTICPDWGYGLSSYRNRTIRLHRIMWQLVRGDDVKGLVVRHKCDNPPCCNPDHLELGTHRDNVHDRMRRGRDHHSSLTHCPRGHDYAVHGTRYGKLKFRGCRICARARGRIAAGWTEADAYSQPALRR